MKIPNKLNKLKNIEEKINEIKEKVTKPAPFQIEKINLMKTLLEEFKKQNILLTDIREELVKQNGYFYEKKIMQS